MRVFSPSEEAQIVAAYLRGASAVKIAKARHCMCNAVTAVLRKRGVQLRGEAYMPTLEEIAVSAAGVRQGWSEADHRARAGLNREPKPYEFPMASTAFRNGQYVAKV